jgi:DNA-binding NarL/FixJ family response regulator
MITDDGLDTLTYAEAETLAFMAAGLSNAGIAHELIVSPRTVEWRVRRIYLKLGVEDDPGINRRVAAMLAYRGARRHARLAA